MHLQKIPVYIVTGFLGSGKTTFLNQWIKAKPDLRIMVIENEIGKTNIDGGLITDIAADIMELTAGCLCCNLNEKLYDLLYDLEKSRNEFDLLIIETTGIADPAAVAETFWTGAFMENNYELKNTICIADAQNIIESLSSTEEARRQLAFADVVLLNKCDLVEDLHISDLNHIIHEIQPGIKIYCGNEGCFPHHDITLYTAYSKEKSENTILKNSENHQFRHEGIHTFSLTYDLPFEYKQLRHTLMLLLHINKHQIYRIKAIIDVPDIENRIIVQSVYNSLRITEGRIWEKDEIRQSHLVFIGKEIEKSSIERILRPCLAKAVAIQPFKS